MKGINVDEFIIDDVFDTLNMYEDKVSKKMDKKKKKKHKDHKNHNSDDDSMVININV